MNEVRVHVVQEAASVDVAGERPADGVLDFAWLEVAIVLCHLPDFF